MPFHKNELNIKLSQHSGDKAAVKIVGLSGRFEIFSECAQYNPIQESEDQWMWTMVPVKSRFEGTTAIFDAFSMPIQVARDLFDVFCVGLFLSP